MGHKIQLSREKKGLKHPEAGLYVKKAIKMALKAEGVAESCYISVMLTDNEGIREINREFRNIDRETDVLSFPQNELTAGEFDPDICERDYESGRILLGDMMISVPKCEEQGKEFGHGFKREVMYLAVHSTLHLLGYDHVDEGEMKAQMRAREKAIMHED